MVCVFNGINENFQHHFAISTGYCIRKARTQILFTDENVCNNQRWSRGHKARGQGQGHKKNSRPRTAFPRTDTLEAKDRNARGQGPRTQAQVLSKKKSLHKNFSGDLLKKKKVFTKIFQAISTKTRFQKIFHALHKILTIQKIVLSSSRGQANFRGLEASRPWPRTSKSVLEDSTSDNNHDIFLRRNGVDFLCFHEYHCKA